MTDPEIERAKRVHAEAMWRCLQDRAVYGAAHVSRVNRRALDLAARQLAYLRSADRKV